MKFPDEEITQVIPRQTMKDLVFGPGQAPIGPDRPTVNMRPLPKPGDAVGSADDTIVEDYSDGVPSVVEHDAPTEPLFGARDRMVLS